MEWVTGVFMGVAIGGALLAVTLPNILHAIFGLGIALLGIAGVFLMLGSPFVAAMQVLIYVGGIAVAMVFAVMLSYAIVARTPGESWARRLGGAVPALFLAAALAAAVLGTDFGGGEPQAVASVADMGRALLTHYNLVFEALSVILLLAIIGAIVIASKEQPES